MNKYNKTNKNIKTQERKMNQKNSALSETTCIFKVAYKTPREISIPFHLVIKLNYKLLPKMMIEMKMKKLRKGFK